jgi:hypothetical protein
MKVSVYTTLFSLLYFVFITKDFVLLLDVFQEFSQLTVLCKLVKEEHRLDLEISYANLLTALTNDATAAAVATTLKVLALLLLRVTFVDLAFFGADETELVLSVEASFLRELRHALGKLVVMLLFSCIRINWLEALLGYCIETTFEAGVDVDPMAFGRV